MTVSSEVRDERIEEGKGPRGVGRMRQQEEQGRDWAGQSTPCMGMAATSCRETRTTTPSPSSVRSSAPCCPVGAALGQSGFVAQFLYIVSHFNFRNISN